MPLSHFNQINLTLQHMVLNQVDKHLNLIQEINQEVKTIEQHMEVMPKSIGLIKHLELTITCIILELVQVALDLQFKVTLHLVRTFNQVVQLVALR